jgi:acetyl esterase
MHWWAIPLAYYSSASPHAFSSRRIKGAILVNDHDVTAHEPIDEGMLAFYETLSAKTPPESVDWPLSEQRRLWDEVCASFRADRPPGVVIEDFTVPGDLPVPVRLFRPEGAGPYPGVIYGHGGGWVLGSIGTHDDMCAEIAGLAEVAVVALDYRLAPENPHPAQLRDSLAVLSFMRHAGASRAIDPARIIAAGDSAGGQMSAGLALWLRDKGLPQLAGQVLIYPVLGTDTGTPSYVRNRQGPCLTHAEMEYYLAAFLGPAGSPQRSEPYAVPLLATDFSGLPPAFITVAAHDPLHDDGLLYHRALQRAGVPSALRREPTLAHSYMRARHHSRPAMAGFQAIAQAVRTLAHDGRLP